MRYKYQAQLLAEEELLRTTQALKFSYRRLRSSQNELVKATHNDNCIHTERDQTYIHTCKPVGKVIT